MIAGLLQKKVTPILQQSYLLHDIKKEYFLTNDEQRIERKKGKQLLIIGTAIPHNDILPYRMLIPSATVS